MAFTQEQRTNAGAIIRVGRSLGASNRDILIALMTAMQESGLRNLNYGDRDSIGMFQQRNAWGSRADRLDPVKSTRMFFLGGAEGQRGLFDFKDRVSMALTEAAQAVQVSAYPDAYAKHESEARSLLGSTGQDIPPGWPQDAPQGDFQQPPALDIAAGLQSPQMAVGAAEAMSSPTPPGLESGDQQPEIDFASMIDNPDDLAFLDHESFGNQFSQTTGVVNGTRDLVVRTAKQFLGTPYVFGGNDPSNGIDCSRLTQLALQAAGVNLPRISYQQARKGRRVGLGQLQPGDLVAWDNSSRNPGADHIALYIGNGMIIEAPRPGLSVRIRQVDDDEGAWGVALDY